jgi:hypothetical protein
MRHIIKRSQPLMGGRSVFSFSELTKSKTSAPSKREYLQFSKKRLVDFGELPFGEIPDALKYRRPSSLKKLPNGVRVASQYWPGHGAAYQFIYNIESLLLSRQVQGRRIWKTVQSLSSSPDSL